MKIGNFCSFQEDNEFSMLPTKERIHRKDHVFKPFPKSIEVLRSGVLYGANGSGKSNFIRAIAIAKRIITEGVRPNKPINYTPFKLDKASKKSASKFYFEIQTHEKAFRYEFHLTSESVVYESLFELTKSSEKLLFSRQSLEDDTKIEFGATIQKLKKHELQNLQFVANGTRKNQLFLTETIERNIELFNPVYNWFSESIRVFSPQSISHGIEFRLGDDERFTNFLRELLSEFDPSIRNISKEFISAETAKGIPQRILSEIENEIDEEGAVFISNSIDGNRSVVMKRDGELVVLKICIERRYQKSTELVTFDLEEESDGTRRLIDLAPLFYELLYSEEPVVAFIDELDRSLHPLTTKRLMELFFARTTQRQGSSQVIITSHNTVLLDIDLLRKDEVWVIEKKFGASTLKSVQRDFSPRYDRDMRKDYLSGMYGGTPRYRKESKQISLDI